MRLTRGHGDPERQLHPEQRRYPISDDFLWRARFRPL